MQATVGLFILSSVLSWAPDGNMLLGAAISGKTQGLPAFFRMIDLLLLNNNSSIPNDPYPAQLC